MNVVLHCYFHHQQTSAVLISTGASIWYCPRLVEMEEALGVNVLCRSSSGEKMHGVMRGFGGDGVPLSGEASRPLGRISIRLYSP